MSKIHSVWKFLKKRKYWSIGGVVALVAILVITHLGSGSTIETVKPEVGDLVRTVRISGKVVSKDKVDLGFETAGIVSSVLKDVGEVVNKGDVLARLDSGTKSAELNKALAELASAEAELNKIEGNSTYENTLTSKKRSIVQAIRNAYTSASDAVYNKADQVFVDPHSSYPVIKGSFKGNDNLRQTVNDGRVTAGETLDKWGELVALLSDSNYSETELNLSKTYLSQIRGFISNVSTAVNLFEETNYMAQSEIDTYKSVLISAREVLNTANDGFISAENGLSQTLSDVPVQVSKVEAANANVLNLRYQLDKTALISPISGVVSRQDAKIGQTISAGTSLVSVISPDYLVETYVPEVSIAGVALGNSANVTFDAYGDEAVFKATVVHIDPAETVRDGVSTYKVKLAFNSTDTRVRSGLTSNVEIETLRKPEVVIIPERSVVREGEQTFVFVMNGEKREKRLVSLGERDSRGNIELLSGVHNNEEIIVNP